MCEKTRVRIQLKLTVETADCWMRARVFSHTYPTYALVGGTSRPAGETVSIISINFITINCRAGTTGIICLMHFAGLESNKVGV